MGASFVSGEDSPARSLIIAARANSKRLTCESSHYDLHLYYCSRGWPHVHGITRWLLASIPAEAMALPHEGASVHDIFLLLCSRICSGLCGSQNSDQAFGSRSVKGTLSSARASSKHPMCKVCHGLAMSGVQQKHNLLASESIIRLLLTLQITLPLFTLFKCSCLQPSVACSSLWYDLLFFFFLPSSVVVYSSLWYDLPFIFSWGRCETHRGQ